MTLLVLNSLANEAMPIFLDALVPSTIAVLISVTAVLFVGEIIPAALFTGRRLRIAASLAPVVRLCMVVLAPAYLLAALGLDWLLPHSRVAPVALRGAGDRRGAARDGDATTSRRRGQRGRGRLVRGALSLGKKLVVDVMTPITGVYMLESTAVLDAPTMRDIGAQVGLLARADRASDGRGSRARASRCSARSTNEVRNEHLGDLLD